MLLSTPLTQTPPLRQQQQQQQCRSIPSSRPLTHPLTPSRQQHQQRCCAIPTRHLGRTDLHVPALCFGTMLFGESSSYLEACRLLDQCMEAGVHFFDSAEMYPVPQVGGWQQHC